MNEVSGRELRVFAVAAYPSARSGLRAMLDGRDGILVVGEAASLDDLGEFAPAHAEVLVVEFDGEMPEDLAAFELPAVFIGPDAGAFKTVAAIARPGAMLLRDAGADEIAAAIRAAAQGLVVLDPAVAGLLQDRPKRVVAESGVTLTARERSVLGLVAVGLPNKGIARELGISEHTVKFHVGAILGKLGAASRAEAVAMAARQGLIAL